MAELITSSFELLRSLVHVIPPPSPHATTNVYLTFLVKYHMDTVCFQAFVVLHLPVL